MKNLLTIAVAVVLLAGLAGCATSSARAAKTSGKPVILVTAFGSSYESGQKNLEDMDTAIRAAYPENEVYWAFTASFIVNKLRKEGQTTLFARETPLMTPDEAYDLFRAEGKTDVAVQVLMVMVGAEFRQVVNTPTNGLNVKYGYPLFFNPEDIQNTASALSGNFGGADTFTLLSAHGNDHHPEFNAELIQLDDYLQENYSNVRVATVEGSPHFDTVKDEVLASGVSEIQFIPLMLTYGDHITNDVMGDEEDSWKVILGKEAECTNGMASNPAIQAIYLSHIKQTLSQF